MNAMSSFFPGLPVRALALAVALAVTGAPAFAQVDHSMHMPPPKQAVKKPAPKRQVATPAAAKPAAAKPTTKPAAPKSIADKGTAPKAVVRPPAKAPVVDPHAGHTVPTPLRAPATSPAAAQVDHAAMGHDMPMPEAGTATEPMDHSAMGHDMPMPAQGDPEPTDPAMPMDHAAMGHDMPMPDASAGTQPMDHAAMGHDMPAAPTEPVTPIPAITAQDRAAAFPDVAGHAVHDTARHSYWLLDRLDVWDAEPGTGVEWEAQSWIGTDLDRLWLRSEGERVRNTTESADIEVLYGRSVAPWWDVVAGVRHDFGHGPSQTFAALGVMGLAPYKYEVEATVYVGQSGQTAARVELEYDTLLTNRLILQSQVEAELHGRDDARRGIGSGLSTVGAGLRLRYEFTRKFAPYIGVVHERAFGGTADLRRGADEDIDDTRIVAGLRLWF